MSIRARSPLPLLVVTLSVLAAIGCESRAKTDPKNREVSWTYGPRDGTAVPEHLEATGTRGKAKLTVGWNFRLQETRLTMRPYQLADAHPLFGKVAVTVALFDQNGQQIHSVQTAPVTPEQSTFQFDLPPEIATKLHDLVLWYKKV